VKRIAWSSAKARTNASKHGVSFVEAATVLTDPLARYMVDPDHADREIGVGVSAGGRLLVVVFSEGRESIRMISARPANDMNAKTTKKPKRASGMRDHYDFRRAKRGRFPDLAGGHVVFVGADVWEHFGSDAAVLTALRGLVELAKPSKTRKGRARRAA
jgi:hypothetical protein